MCVIPRSSSSLGYYAHALTSHTPLLILSGVSRSLNCFSYPAPHPLRGITPTLLLLIPRSSSSQGYYAHALTSHTPLFIFPGVSRSLSYSPYPALHLPRGITPTQLLPIPRSSSSPGYHAHSLTPHTPAPSQSYPFKAPNTSTLYEPFLTCTTISPLSSVLYTFAPIPDSLCKVSV